MAADLFRLPIGLIERPGVGHHPVIEDADPLTDIRGDIDMHETVGTGAQVYRI